MLDVSVCIIARDEEINIKSAIMSAGEFAKEIVVLDTGSRDNTMEVARQTGAKVYEAPWNHHFAEMRNMCISYATMPFILFLDADEEISSYNIETICQYCEAFSTSKGLAGRVLIQNDVDGEVVTSYVTRLFPNHHDYRYHGRIHEQLQWKGEIVPTTDLDLTIVHKGYSPVEIARKDKINRNIRLLMEDSEFSNPSYHAFQLGQTYYLAKEYEKAIPHLQQAVADDDSSSAMFVSAAWLSLGYCYLYLRQWELFLHIFQKAIEKYPNYTDLYYMYGVALIESRNPQWFANIPEAFEICLTIGECNPSIYQTNHGVGSYKAHYNLGLYYELMGDVHKALLHYEEGENVGYQPAKDRRGFLLAKRIGNEV